MFSELYAAALGDHARGRTASSMGSTWLALYISAPDIAGGSATINEAAYSGYARLACGTGGSSIFTAGNVSTGTASNNQVLLFPALASGSVTITWIGIVDSSSGSGVLRMAAQLIAPITYTSGQQPRFNIGDLTDMFE